jgi:hypothetical protein
MAELFYALCTVTAALCSWLLLRAYRRSGYKLLFWGGLCFIGLTLNNALVIVDKVFFPVVINLFVPRLLVALAGMLVLLYGIIWDRQ